MKKAKVTENFYLESLFILKSCPCFINVSKENGSFSLYLTAREGIDINLAFIAEKGLARLKSDGSIDDENILGDFISINNEDNEFKRANLYANFFSNNGFLFNLLEFKNKYIHLESLDTYNYYLSQLMILYDKISDGERLNVDETISVLKSLLFDRTDSKIHTLTLDLQSYEKYISQSAKSSLQRLGQLSIYDTAKKENVLISEEDFYHYLVSNDADSKILRTNPYFKEIYTLYVLGTETLSDVTKRAIDLFTNYYFNEKEHETQTKLKKATYSVAKDVFKEEIDYFIRNIKPSYNKEKLMPAWSVDSLLSALYFSFFYMNPNTEIYRICSFCKKPFKLDKSTSTKKIYCSDKCRNAANQRKYRIEHRKKDTPKVNVSH